MMGLKPEEYYNLTPKEWELFVEGDRKRQKRMWEPFALLASYISAGFKSPKTYSDIMRMAGFAPEHKKKNLLDRNVEKEIVKYIFKKSEKKKDV